MDDELDRAAQRQRAKQKKEAEKQRQRQRVEADRRAELLAAPQVAAVPMEVATSSSSAAAPAAVPATASLEGVSIKEAVAAKWRELVAEGVKPTAAATQALQLVRASLQSSSGGGVGPLKRQAPEGAEQQEDGAEGVHFPGGPYTCFICIEEKAADERFLPHRCAVQPEKLCCKPCYVAWVESQMDAEAAEIKCCHCDLELAPWTLQRLVDAAHWERHCETNLQRTLRRDQTFIWCSKCSGGGWVNPREPHSACGWICPGCSNSFVYCQFCRREHGSLTCKRFQQLRHEVLIGRRNIDEQSSEGLVARSSKTCPSCKMPIQKDGGCNFMDCPHCRRHFCWSCGSVLKGSHQAHKCDAGFEGSQVISKTPLGKPCVELTRLFTNVLDLDNVELLNADEADLGDLKEMLVPGLAQEPRSPLFVGPSACDGEVLLRLPFNFRKSMCWELTHILVRAVHPPAPHAYPPRSIALLPNVPSANFTDFEDPTTEAMRLQEVSPGMFLVPLEGFRSKGTFRRVTSLSLHFSVRSPPDEQGMDDGAHPDPEAQVFFNDLALFGLPGDGGTRSATRNPMMDERANLIVSPVLNRRWGEERGGGGDDGEAERAPTITHEDE